MFILWIMLGAVIGYAIACLMFSARNRDNIVPKAIQGYPKQRECQIHPSYACLGAEECRGNPSYCEMAVLNNLAGREGFEL